METLSSLKSFLPVLLTFVLPRAISYYRTIKTAYRTRPPAKPLADKTSRALNVLLLSICFFLLWAWPLKTDEQNVFAATNTRLLVPSDVLFSRLALIRPNHSLTPFDETLKTVMSSPVKRRLYLRFGPKTLANCQFCQPEDDMSYLLYHLPSNVLLLHLLHFLFLGLATSNSVAGLEAWKWRNKSTFGALTLAIADVYFTSTFVVSIDGNAPALGGLYWRARVFRPLILCLADALLAFLIYASATNRFLLFVLTAEHEPEVAKRQQEQMLSQTNVSMQMAHTKLMALRFARNATVREPRLKAADDEYWRAMVAMEGPTGSQSVWEDEEVNAAISRTLGSGEIDVARMGREADTFINSLTQGL